MRASRGPTSQGARSAHSARRSPESATAAYTSLVRPDDLSLVVVGDAERIADPLRALGFDDLVVVPAD